MRINLLRHLLLMMLIVMAAPVSAQPSNATSGEKGIVYIDIHNHLSGGRPARPDYYGATRNALAKMDELGIQKILVMPPPFSVGQRGIFEIDAFLSETRKYPGRIGILGGGGSLNAMIHEERNADSVSPETRDRFAKKAAELLTQGAIGFGEFAVEHFSLGPDHPYESVAADHPLLLLMADIAAKSDVPMDIHMEAIPQAMDLPDRPILKRSGNNPQRLRENISALERLLAHNPKARIIWAHVGWCNTGFRTPDLCRALFQRHPNLFMSIKLSQEGLPAVRPVTEDGKTIKHNWLQLFTDFPDRFLIGTDQFYVPPGDKPIGPQKTEATKQLMTALPAELARQIGIVNPMRLFNLKP